MFLHHLGPQEIGGLNDVATVIWSGVVGVAHRQMGELLPQSGNLVEVCVRIGGWVFQHTVEQHQQLVVILADGVHRPLDLIQVGGPNRQENGLLLFGLVGDKGQVGQIRRGDLIDLHEGLQIIRRLHIKGGGAKLDP